MDRNEKERLKAEAKVIIASSYFDMFQSSWWIAYSKSVFAAENEYDVPRATVEETVNFMIGLLDEAATVLLGFD